MEEKKIPVSEKYSLSIKEAADYFSIGTKKMRRLAEDNLGDFAVYSGNRYLIIRDRFEEYMEEHPEIMEEVEKVVGGYTGFLYLDKNGMPEVAMHWEHRFNHAVSRYNEIYREQLPNITPHVCRHYVECLIMVSLSQKTSIQAS